jgi:biopolymer transport protein ExbD
MKWKIRHQGSPRSVDEITLDEIVQGLQDGQWEPDDEVMGPTDKEWVAIENHPQLEELAADLEPPSASTDIDEARLDMNPVIDVALVLLVFFMLTASYAAIQRVLEMPSGARKASGRLVYSPDQVKELLIKVTAELGGNGETVYHVESEEVDEKYLRHAIAKYVKEKGRTELVIDAKKGVEWAAVVAIQDAAQGAGVTRALYLKESAEDAAKEN